MEYFNEIIEFKLRKNKEFTLVSFEIKRELVPEDLKKIKPPDPVKENISNSCIILSGRGPIWLYGFLIHFYHPSKAIAVFDPRLDGAVVVESHTFDYKVGDIISKRIFPYE